MNNINYGNQGPGGQMHPQHYVQGGQPNRMGMQQGNRMMTNQQMQSQNMVHMQRYPNQQGQPAPHPMNQLTPQQRYLFNVLAHNLNGEFKLRFDAAKDSSEKFKILTEFKNSLSSQSLSQMMHNHQRQAAQNQMHQQVQRQGSFQMGQQGQFPQQGQQHEQFQQMRSQQFMGQPALGQEQKPQIGQQNSPQVVQRPGSVKAVVQPSPQFAGQYQQSGPSVNGPGTPQQATQIKNHSPMPPGQQIGQIKTIQRPGGPPSVNQGRPMQYAPSPGTVIGSGVQNQSSQPNAGQQPPSVQSQRAGTPNTQRRAGQTPTPADKDQPEYKAVLDELKSMRPQITVLLERVKLDRHHNLENSLVKVIEVMDGRKDVDIKLMQRLLGNVKHSINVHKPTRALIDFVSRINKVPAELESNYLPDKWDPMDKYKIRVPQRMRDSIKQAMEEDRLRRKRKAPTMTEVKVENDDQGAVYELKSHTPKAAKIRVKRAMFEELEKYNYYVDPDFLPVTDNSSYVQVIVDFKPKEMNKLDYAVPPLRLLIPRDYPAQPVQLGQLVPFKADIQSPVTVKVMEALTREANEQVLSSLVDLITTWRKVAVKLLIPNADREIRKQLGVC
ncbi:unnamed protein product [Bursaphelenchus okinawaensis]|uniref:ARC105/Med15 mediator subunit C-terminal domain-containing protein n=1 Tax=Bursaphelenchus okinawaensis TaxID=465554 RepID=A0A811KSV2_9BILA|nr:unnamed protein product [Bursaphelenchus okinawaensis]CAG9112057.1 unnamed protein product [Bursaphelenchus okinawaensis]